MNIGKLDRRVTIEHAVRAQDSAGQEKETWGVLATVWASKLRKSAGEGVSAEQLAFTSVETYQIRFRADVNERMRLQDSGRTYDITAVSEIGRRQGLQITAEYHG